MSTLRIRRLAKRLTLLTAGGLCLETSGCTIDETLLTDLVNLTMEVVLEWLLGSYAV